MTWPTSPGVNWSTQVDEAGWIAERLLPFDAFCVGSVVPQGFAAYARILHPARGPDDQPVRWRKVADWSGRMLRPESEFHAVAFPETKPSDPLPWRQGPCRGTLDPGDAKALVAILERHTGTPESCWFCIWNGYGWEGGSVLLSRSGKAPHPVPPQDPVPGHVRAGPLVVLPYREYFLYAGPTRAALAFVAAKHQTPNLWWPSDKRWCVASEIDLPWTYLGGSEELVQEVLASSHIEALPTETATRNGHQEQWVEELVQGPADLLIETGACTIETTIGTVWASLETSRLARGRLDLVTRRIAETGTRGESRSPHGKQSAADARSEIVWRLAAAIVGLAE